MKCTKCDSEWVGGAKFCGKCGEKKPKKERNYSEGFLFLSFILLFIGMFDGFLGFILEGGSESYGQNTSRLLWVGIFLYTAQRVLAKAKKKDAGDKEAKYYTSEMRKVVIMILVLVATGGFLVYNSRPVDSTAMIEDALYGTNQTGNNKYTEVLGEIFAYYKTANQDKFPSLHAIDNSNILETSSYKSSFALLSSINLIKKGISEIDNHEAVTTQIKKEAADIVRTASYLSEEDKADIIKYLINTDVNTTQTSLARERFASLKVYYQELLVFYQYLSNNYETYDIELDENGEEKIAFNVQWALDQFTEIAKNVDDASHNFVLADKRFTDYMNSKFLKRGVNIKTEEILNYFNS